MSSSITVCKRDSGGREVWSYHARILRQDHSGLLVEAFFDRERVELGLLALERGDRFLESYYFDRWYNVFAIYAGKDGPLKGWYCNIARPAELHAGRLCADDLALDLLVLPDGRMKLVDEDEFHALGLNPAELLQARRALDELRGMLAAGRPPFSPA